MLNTQQIKGNKMARGRMISQTIDYDPEFNALSIEAQLLYLRAIPFLDRDGLIVGNPFGLLGRIAPLMESFAPQMPSIINEWIEQGLVVRYSCKIGPVLFFKGFAKNQSGMHYDREGESRFDPPPGWVREEKGMVQNESGVSPELVRSESGKSPAEVKVEVKDQDQEKEKAADARTHTREETPSAAVAIDPSVAQVWKCWSANMPGTLTPVIVDSVNELLEQYSAAEIQKAITIACESDSRNLRFIKGVLARGAFSEKSTNGNGKDKIHEAAEASRRSLIAAGKEHLL